MSRVMLIDPLTLVGRELLAHVESSTMIPTIEYRHTADDDEHQVAELGGNPALVPPLSDPAELNGFDAVVVASHDPTERLDLVARFLETDAGATLLVDLGGSSALRALTRATTPFRESGDLGGLRVAHPALVAADPIIRAFEPFGIAGGAVSVIEPASAWGRDAVEGLARQSAARLKGEPAADEIDGLVLAFNHVPLDPSGIEEDARALFPGLDLTILRAATGLFHGHVTTVALEVDEPVSAPDAEGMLSDVESLIVVDLRSNLDRVIDTDRVAVTPPVVSDSGRRIAVTAIADGLRVTAAAGWRLASSRLAIS